MPWGGIVIMMNTRRDQIDFRSDHDEAKSGEIEIEALSPGLGSGRDRVTDHGLYQ